MPVFDYLAVFYSLIIGLTVARVLSGFAALITHRPPIRWYPPFVAWGIFLLLYSALEWWLISRWMQQTSWSFALYFFIAIRPSLLYFATHILFPDFAEQQAIDLRDHFLRTRLWLTGILALMVLIGFADTALKGGAYFLERLAPQTAISAIVLAIYAAAARTRNDRLALLLPLLLIAVYFVAVVVL